MKKSKKFTLFNMNNFKIKIMALFLLNAVSLVISHQLETDRVSEERDKIFSDYGCKEGECEILNIELPSRHKRSVDSTIDLPIKAFGREMKLQLLQSDDDALFGPNTPVYYAQSSTNIKKTTFGTFSSQMRSKLYEDEQHLAAFTLDESEDGSLQIKSGYIGSEHITIERLHRNSNSSQLRQPYLAKFSLGEIIKESFSLLGDVLRIGIRHQHPSRPDIPIPDIIYPEILIIVDFALSQQYGESVVQHVVEFWHQVDMIYRQIKNPDYKLNIAGIVLPQTERAINFLRSGMNYESALYKMTTWLQRASNSIPYSSYDVHMVMTPHNDYQDGYETLTEGVTSTPSACTGILYKTPHGGITSEKQRGEQDYLIAAHELGHALGANHDSLIYGDPLNLIMAETTGPNQQNRWSRRSIQDLHQTLKITDYSCMYIKPDVGHNNKYPPAGNGYSEPTDNSDSNDYKNSNNIIFSSINDDDILVFDLSEFAPDRKIAVFYLKEQLVITQIQTEKVPESWSQNQEKSDLRIRQPDSRRIMLNPATINPSKPIHFAHDKGYIYAYQMADTSSKENVESTRYQLYPTSKPDLHVSFAITNKIFVERSDFNLYKMVNVYIDKRKLYVSQKYAPENNDLKVTPLSQIQYCQNANQPITFNPLLMNPDKELQIMYTRNQICMSQESSSYLPFSQDDTPNNETVGTETVTRMPAPVTMGTTPKSDLKSPVTDFNITVESEVMLAIFPYEFNLEKLVLVSFENGRLKVTQIGAPEETNPNLLDVLDTIHTVTSDENKLLLHPARIRSQYEIKMIHRNNDIYIWTKSDQEPDINVDNPDLVQIITPEMDIYKTPDVNVSMSDDVEKGNESNLGGTRRGQPISDNRIPESYDTVMPTPVTLGTTPKSDLKSPVTDFNIAVKSEVMLAISPHEFNLDKLVLISFEDGKLKVTQIGAPEEINPYLLNGLNSLQTVTSDENKLLLHPARIPFQDKIKMIHSNEKIYIWTKSNQRPEIDVDNPGLVQVIRPEIDYDKTPDVNVSMSDDVGKVNVPNPGETIRGQPISDNRIPESYDTVMPAPVTLGTAPKSGQKSPVTDFNIAVKSEVMLAIFPYEFNLDKLVLISFENGRLKVTQIGAPEETNPNLLDVLDIIHTVTSDENKLLLHPARISSQYEIKMIHRNNDIYIWTKSDQEPDINVDNPDLVQIITPEMDIYKTPDVNVSMSDDVDKVNAPNPGETRHGQPISDNRSSESDDEVTLKPDHRQPKSDHRPSKLNDSTIEDFSKSVDDSLPVLLTLNMFNPKKWVVISHKNHKINVYQIDRNGNDDVNAGYVDLHYSFSDKTTLSFDPLMMDPKKLIVINYIDNETHVNSVKM